MSFIKTFTLSTIIIFSLFAGLIISVDPYDKMGINVFNFKTKAVAQSRENKFRMYESSTKKYEAFILGSSSAHRYPTKKVESLTGLKTFNYAVQHSTPIDFLAITKHIISKNKPKLLLLQVDFSALNEHYKVDNRLFHSPLNDYLKKGQDEAKTLIQNDYFTLKALSDSLRVFHVNWFGKARHIYAEDGNYVFEKIKPHKIKVKQDTRENFVFSKERLSLLLEIKELAKNHNFKLVIFTTPIAFNHFQRITSNLKLKSLHEEFISIFKENFDNFVNFQNEELESSFHYENYIDSVHPTKKLSEEILEKLF